MSLLKGKVKWYNDMKGYGFIAKEDGTGEVFVHYSSIASGGVKTLDEGDLVQFEVVPSDKGLKALKVVRV